MDTEGVLRLELRDGYTRSNFSKNLTFSPDGSSFLLSTEEGNLYCYAETNTNYATSTSENYDFHRIDFPRSEPVYDLKWYPFMTRQDPATCCFLSCSKQHPIHLWDASGSLRCTYKGHNHLDELDSPYSLAFNLTGDKIYAGSERMIRCFDVANPTSYTSHPTCTSRKDKYGQKGLISCLEFNPDYSGCYAAGSYSNSVFVYVENTKGSALEVTNLSFGVTCVKWSKCGNYLFIGGRRSDSILCWDVRMSLAEVGRVERKCDSSQKMTFDVDPSGKYLWTGSQDGRLLQYDTATLTMCRSVDGLPDSVSAVHCRPQHAASVGLCTGQRHFDISASDADDSDSDSVDDGDNEGHADAGGNQRVGATGFDEESLKYSAVQIWSF